MGSGREAQFDALIERSSLGTAGARDLRRRTSPYQAATVRRISDLRYRVVHSVGESKSLAGVALIRLLRELGYERQVELILSEEFPGREAEVLEMVIVSESHCGKPDQVSLADHASPLPRRLQPMSPVFNGSGSPEERTTVNSIYLGPSTPRWEPRTEDDLRDGVDGGLLEESHWVELKREIPQGKRANRELARDLASFAVDGGTLIVGVEETHNGPTLAPQPTKGMPERVESVAHTIPDPPLHVRTRVIPTAGDPDRGYLVVSVPPSPEAPHMVENCYLARGDKTKRFLSDPEVRQLHGRRRALEDDLHHVLQWQVSRDPIPDGRHAHLFLVAQPQPGRPEMLHEVISGRGWQQRLLELRAPAVDGGLLRSTGLSAASPNLSSASIQQHRHDGKALVSSGLTEDRRLSPHTSRESVIEWEVSEDGQMRVYCSRLSYAHGGPDEPQQLLEMLLVLLVRQLVAVVTAACDRVGYFGAWGLGVACTRVRGLSAHPPRSLVDLPPYTEPEYLRLAFATYADLTQTPGAVTSALIGRFLRAIDVDQAYAKALNDDA